jgi:DNA-binding MarR family transcriptional regulator
VKQEIYLSAADYRALADFRFEVRRFLHFSEEAARREKLAPQHHQLLLAVKGFSAGASFVTWPTVRHLAERLQIAHHSAVELIDRCVGAGLVKRVEDEKDRRRVHVRLTRKGEGALDRLSRQHRDELKVAGRALIEALKAVTSG